MMGEGMSMSLSSAKRPEGKEVLRDEGEDGG